MKYKKDGSGKNIVLTYPSQTGLSDRIKIVWSQS